MTVFSCYGCEKRSGECHATCETYKKEKSEHDKRKAERDKKRTADMGVYDERSIAVHKANRKRRTYK